MVSRLVCRSAPQLLLDGCPDFAEALWGVEEFRRRRDAERRAALAELTQESYRIGLYDQSDAPGGAKND